MQGYMTSRGNKFSKEYVDYALFEVVWGSSNVAFRTVRPISVISPSLPMPV